MINLVWELYDGKTHREECAEILANAYMVMKKCNLVQQPIRKTTKVDEINDA